MYINTETYVVDTDAVHHIDHPLSTVKGREERRRHEVAR